GGSGKPGVHAPVRASRPPPASNECGERDTRALRRLVSVIQDALICRWWCADLGEGVLCASLEVHLGQGVRCRVWLGLAGHRLARTGLAGSPDTKSSPRCTQLASASSAAKPAGSTQMKPDRVRPPSCIGRTCGSRSACSRPLAPTRTMSALSVMPQHILPLTRND